MTSSSSTFPAFKPDNIEIEYVKNKHFSGIDSYYAELKLTMKQQTFFSPAIRLIDAIDSVDGEIRFRLDHVLKTMIFGTSLLTSLLTSLKPKEIVDALKEAGKIRPDPDPIDESSFLNRATIEQILLDIKDLNIGDYSLLLDLNILFKIECEIASQSQNKRIEELKFTLQQREGDAKKLVVHIEKQRPFIKNIESHFNINDYPRMKKLRETIDLLFPPQQSKTNKRQRR